MDPNSAWAWLRSGWTNHYASNPDNAIEHFQRPIRLSPSRPDALQCPGQNRAAHFGKSEYDEAVKRQIEQVAAAS